MKKLALILSLLFFFNCANNTTQNANAGVSATQNVTSETFNTDINGDGQGLIIDVRTPKEYAQGHIKNALSMDFLNNDFVEKIKTLPKERNIYLYCRSGRRSAEAAKLFEQNGFQHVYNLEGGIIDWEKEGLPIVTE